MQRVLCRLYMLERAFFTALSSTFDFLNFTLVSLPFQFSVLNSDVPFVTIRAKTDLHT